MANVIPKEVKKEIIDGYVAETWKACLLSNLFTYATGTHVSYSDLTNEIAGTGYTAGGATVAGKVGAYVDTTNQFLNATDVAWTGATFANARYVAVYNTVSGKIRAIYDFGADKSVTSGTFTVQWSGSGLIKIS